MLTELQMVKLPNFFHMFDADNNGQIEAADVEKIIAACAQRKGWTRTDEAYTDFHNEIFGLWIAMTTMADKNQDDQLSFEEFSEFFDMLMQDEENFLDVIYGLSDSLFGAFDSNSNGMLSAAEFEDFYLAVGLRIDTAAQVYAALDYDADGDISIEELKELVNQFFTSQDKNAIGNILFGPLVLT
ncbi:MAG: EF-hand domain-containing protein [Chloroflexota bacterium]